MTQNRAENIFRDDAAIRRVGEGMIGSALPSAEWTHAAHWAAALWVIACRSDLHAPDVMPSFIRRYNESCGKQNTDTAGYHETITQASLRAAHSFLVSASPGEALHQTLARLMASDLGRSDWLLTYWSKPILFSPEARRTWIAPDLRALPWPEFPAAALPVKDV